MVWKDRPHDWWERTVKRRWGGEVRPRIHAGEKMEKSITLPAKIDSKWTPGTEGPAWKVGEGGGKDGVGGTNHNITKFGS